MNTCPQDEKLGALVDGELAEPERSALEAHLRGCTACAAAAAAFRELDRAAAAAPAPAVSREEWDAAWRAILGRMRAARRRPAPWRRAAVWAAAAAASLALAAGALLIHQGSGAPPSGQVAAQCVAEEVEAGPGYAATVSYSQDGEATLITVSPISLEEAPRDAPSGDVL